MKRVSGIDATFLYSETPTVHMHTLKVAIIDRPKGKIADLFQHFRDEFEARLHLLPAFRQRAVEVPYGLHHPVWIEDPHFDLDYHLRRVSIPSPGGRREMDRVISDIASHPLDRNHPLWEIWLLEGLADRRLAFVAKIHHALADGGASAQMLANVMVADPDEAAPIPGDPDTWSPEPIPSPTRLVIDALADKPRRARELGPLVVRTARGVRSVIDGMRDAGTTPTRPFHTPHTPFNRALSPVRSFASTTLPIARVKKIKTALGVTLNDVVLGIVGRSVARYLDERGQHPELSLTAAVPVAVLGEDTGPRLQGNRLSNLITSLCTDVEDPVEQLRRIHEAAVVAKETHERLGADVFREWTEYAPPRTYGLAFRLYTDLRLADLHRPAANLIASNVRGPAAPLYVAGVKLHGLFSVGPILDGLGLNLTAWSYHKDLSFGVIASRDAVPDPHAITDGLHDALAAFETAAGTRRKKAS